MIELPEPVIAREECAVSSGEYYTRDQMLQFRRDALEEAANISWVELMRDGQLVTWGDAATLGYRVIEMLRELEDET